MQHLPVGPLDEEGSFVFEVEYDGGLTVRSQPNAGDEYRTGLSFGKGDLVSIDYVRQNPVADGPNGPFLRLSDCSGWLFQHKNGQRMMKSVPVEAGLWTFYVDNAPYGQSLRRHPCDRLSLCMDELVVYKPMQKIYCDRRVKHPSSTVSFYRVQGTEGWVFDRRPEDEFGSMLLDESQVQTGLFAFLATMSISVRKEPSVTDECRTARTVNKGEIVVGDILRENPYHSVHGPFLRLTDGSGWLFQKKDGHSVMEPLVVEKGVWKFKVVNSTGITLLRQPIDDSSWTTAASHDWRTTTTYDEGEVVTCDRRIIKVGAKLSKSPKNKTFYRVENTGGWIFDQPADNLWMNLLKNETNHPRAGLNTGLPPDGWNPHFVRGIATTVEGLTEIAFNPTTCLLSFRSSDGVNIKVYYATRTVGTSTSHHSKLQLFRENCSPSDLVEIFKSPHAHSGGEKQSQKKTRFRKDAPDVIATPHGLGIVVVQEEILRQKLVDCMSDERRLQKKRAELLISIRSFDVSRAKEAAKMEFNIQVREFELEAAKTEDHVIEQQPGTEIDPFQNSGYVVVGNSPTINDNLLPESPIICYDVTSGTDI